MPNLKISAMPGLGTNAAPGDLLTVVDVSAPAATANKQETLNNLLSVITRGITDKALRFQAGTAPAVSLAAEGAIYFDGSNFQISANGGAYAPLLSLSPQADHAVLIGPLSGGPTAPTWRGLTLSDLPAVATDRLLGRVSPLSGDVEEITPGAGVLTWLQTPSSANLLAAVTDETGGGLANNGLLVFNQSPTIISPSIANILSGSNQTALRLTGSGSNNFIEIVNAAQPTGPTIQATGTPQADISLLIKSKGTGNVDITGSAIRAFGPTTADPGILEARGGNQLYGGGKIYLYERSNNGSNYVGFEAPDSLASDLFWTLPSVDGTAGQALVTDGGSGLSWASFVSNSIATNSFLGRTAAGTGPVQTLTAGAGVLTWLQTPTADNLRSAVTSNTGTGNLVFASGPTFTGQTAFAGGTFAAPGIVFSGDVNTGIYSPAADTLGIVTAGAAVLAFGPSGNITTGGTFNLNTKLELAGTFTQSGGFARGIRITGTIPSTVTGNYVSNQSLPATQAAAFVCPNIIHYSASNFLQGAGSSATAQTGFLADNLISGINNYGFFGSMSAAAGRWNFYADGTAANFFRGNTGINSTVFGTSAAGVLSLGTGTAPTTGPADSVQIFSTDLSAGNTILSLYTEGAGSTSAGITNTTVTTKIALRVNGVVYYLLATTDGT